MASLSENRGNSLLSRLCRLKSFGKVFFLVAAFLLMRTTDAWRLCTRAGARYRGIVGTAGRAPCVTVSLAMEAKHRSIGAIFGVVGLEAPESCNACRRAKRLGRGLGWPDWGVPEIRALKVRRKMGRLIDNDLGLDVAPSPATPLPSSPSIPPPSVVR